MPSGGLWRALSLYALAIGLLGLGTVASLDQLARIAAAAYAEPALARPVPPMAAPWRVAATGAITAAGDPIATHVRPAVPAPADREQLAKAGPHADAVSLERVGWEATQPAPIQRTAARGGMRGPHTLPVEVPVNVSAGERRGPAWDVVGVDDELEAARRSRAASGRAARTARAKARKAVAGWQASGPSPAPIEVVQAGEDSARDRTANEVFQRNFAAAF
jgi:hypothetical protein